MRDQSEVIPGDYSPLRVELLPYGPKHRPTVGLVCKVLQDIHRPLYLLRTKRSPRSGSPVYAQ